jgi:hypothetical protein
VAAPNLIAERALLLLRQTGAHTDGDDPTSDALLEGLLRGLLDPAGPLSLWAHGDGVDVAPWEAYTDPTKATLDTIAYAAQWTGGTVPTRRSGESDDVYLARARAELARARNVRRGSRESIEDVVRGYVPAISAWRVVPSADGTRWNHIVYLSPGDMASAPALSAVLNHPAVVPAGARIQVLSESDAIWANGATVWSAVPVAATWANVTADQID